MPVLLGSKEKLPVRLVAQRLPEEQAQKKRQKARNDRNKKANHSQEYYALLGWVRQDDKLGICAGLHTK